MATFLGRIAKLQLCSCSFADRWLGVEVSDKQTGDEMVFTDLHEMVIRERMILLLLPLGYASEDVLVPDLKRKPVEHITKLY
ncbi:unnamed protein product [Caenorhabditis nigoni]